MSRKKYQTYSKEFKIEAVRLAEQSDKPVTQVARELGIRQNQIYKWRKQLEAYQEKAFPGKGRRSMMRMLGCAVSWLWPRRRSIS